MNPRRNLQGRKSRRRRNFAWFMKDDNFTRFTYLQAAKHIRQFMDEHYVEIMRDSLFVDDLGEGKFKIEWEQ